MAHHKRLKPKNARSGCLMCKNWKINGFGKTNEEWEKHSDHVKRMNALKEIEELYSNRKSNGYDKTQTKKEVD